LIDTHHQPKADPVYGDLFAALPQRHNLIAGGFNFAPFQVLHDVPYDTVDLPHLLFGEELSSYVVMDRFFASRTSSCFFVPHFSFVVFCC
jgi:hypothetical protein